MNNQMNLVGVYEYNEDALLVEVIINEFPDCIDFLSFCVPDNTIDKSSWQVAYMEQFLNPDGTDKLCETYDIPTEQIKPTRLAFFLFKTDNHELSTPYGGCSLKNLQKLPDRLSKFIDFHEFD